MDVDKLYTAELHEKGAQMQVKDQNGKPLDVYLTLAGVDSKLYRSATSTMRRGILKSTDREKDSDELRAEALAVITINWTGLTSKGKELKFSKEEVKKLYLNAPYLMDQADAFITERGNFTKG